MRGTRVKWLRERFRKARAQRSSITWRQFKRNWTRKSRPDKAKGILT